MPAPTASAPKDPRPRARRLETWLWSGPLGHLLGGALDFTEAMARYLRARSKGKDRPDRPRR